MSENETTREENFATTLGIDTPASRALWRLLNGPDGSDRERAWYMKYIGNFQAVVNRIHPRDFDYLSKLYVEHMLHKAYSGGGWENLHHSLLSNVMKTICKERRRKLNGDKGNEN